MEFKKHNFPLYTRVKFVNCSNLTGLIGTILKKSVEGILDFYIVLFDENQMSLNGYKNAAASCPEACLEQIDDCVVTEIWNIVSERKE